MQAAKLLAKDALINPRLLNTGSYTRTETGGSLGSGSGTNSYSLTETANVNTGDFSLTETGTDRYELLEQFDNIAQTSGVSTPGHMNYNPFGEAFVDDAAQKKDPPLDEIPLPGTKEPDLATKIIEAEVILGKNQAIKEIWEEAKKNLDKQQPFLAITNKQAGGNAALFDFTNKQIALNAERMAKMSSSEIAAHLLFEALRYKYRKEQEELVDRVKNGKITEDECVEAQEKLGLKYANEHHQLFRQAFIKKDISSDVAKRADIHLELLIKQYYAGIMATGVAMGGLGASLPWNYTVPQSISWELWRDLQDRKGIFADPTNQTPTHSDWLRAEYRRLAPKR